MQSPIICLIIKHGCLLLPAQLGANNKVSTEPKTKPTNISINHYLASIKNLQQRQDSQNLVTIMQKITGYKPVIWGASIVGFGQYHYKYKSGREGDWLLTGFAARKQALTIYVMPGSSDFDALIQQLGQYKLGKSCLYIKSLDDIDIDILQKLIKQSVNMMKVTYGITAT